MEQRRSLIALTTDIWSDNAVSSYLGLTAHYFDEKLVLQSRFLGSEKLAVNHNGELIRESTIKNLGQYDLTMADISKIVTDGASNMVKAFKNDMICKFFS